MQGVEKYKYIDVLRGIAIIGVLAVHSYQNVEDLPWFVEWIMNYGQLGVQLFFVASAITLCLSMRSRGDISNVDFFIRRYFRIAPLYYFGIILYLVFRVSIHWIQEGSLSVPEKYSFANIALNVLLLHGLHPGAFNYVVPGGWSIATEVLFYCSFPFLWKILITKGDRYFFRMSLVIALSILFVQILFFWILQPYVVGSGIMRTSIQNEQFGFVYASVINQAPVFLAGMIAYTMISRGHVAMRVPMYITAATLIILSVALQNAPWMSIGINGYIYPLLSGIAFSVIAIVFSARTKFDNQMWTLLTYIGKLSFSIYIIQSFVLGSLKLSLGEIEAYVALPSVVKLIIIFSLGSTISILLSRYSHRFIELRGISYGKEIIEMRERRRTVENCVAK